MYVSTARPWFTFLVHPRSVRDLDLIRAASLLRRYSATEQEYVDKACTLPPLVLGDVRVAGSQVRGEVVCAVRMPDQIMAANGMQAVVDSAKLAVQRGTPIIGLGALTAPAMGGGVRLLRHLPDSVKVTNGNGFTAAVARTNVAEAVQYLNLGHRPRVAVLGSTGSVGGAASRLLADEDYHLILLGRTVQRVRHLLGDLERRAELACGLDALAAADVVVALTHDRTARLTPELLKPGAVVVDVAAPYNIEPERRPDFLRRGIAVVKGGLARIPGFMCAQDFDNPGPTDTFACLAETYLLAREGLFENSIGRPTADYARQMEGLAVRHGVGTRPIGEDLAAVLRGDQPGAAAINQTQNEEYRMLEVAVLDCCGPEDSAATRQFVAFLKRKLDGRVRVNFYDPERSTGPEKVPTQLYDRLREQQVQAVPVLVIDGVVVSQGRLPDWLESLDLVTARLAESTAAGGPQVSTAAAIPIDANVTSAKGQS